VLPFSVPLFSLVLMMTLFTFLSHGTQDLYPDFLTSFHGLSRTTAANVAMIYTLGAMLGGILFGEISQRIGRRYGIICALVLCILVIPLWAFSGTLVLLALGAFLMQVGVQGAWGIVPAHLNEIAPDSARGLVPGLAYQLGILFAAPVNNIEYALRDKVGYQWALAGFEVATIVLLGIVVLLGRENKGKSFVAEKVLAASVPVES
jgi:MFS transporter, SHS family, lactate transporter